MKGTDREIYLIIAGEIDSSLCVACRFSSGGDCCTGSFCEHPLSDRIGFPCEDMDLEINEDCWGFRPALSVEHLSDIAGFVLSNGWDEWFWRVYQDGTIKVYGRDNSKIAA